MQRGMEIEESILTGIDIKKADGKFVITRTHADGRVVENEVYDQVFNCWGRVCKTGGLKIENMPGVKVSHAISETLHGGNHGVHELTGNERVFAVGDVLRGTTRNNPAAEFGGKRVANMIKDLINLQNPSSTDNKTTKLAVRKEDIYNKYRNFSYFPMPFTVFSTPSASAIGMMEDEAISQYGQDNVKSIIVRRKPLLDDFAGNSKGMHHYKIISLKDTGKVVGMHYVGEEGEEVIYGLAIAMKQGLTLQTLKDSFFIHPSRSEVFWKAADSDESHTIDSC